MMNNYRKARRFKAGETYWYPVPTGAQQAMVQIELLVDGSDLTPRRCEVQFVGGDGTIFPVHPDRIFERFEVPPKVNVDPSNWVTCPTCNGENSIRYILGLPRACSTCNGHASITRELYERVYAPKN